jgi:hypothetical protein
LFGFNAIKEIVFKTWSGAGVGLVGLAGVLLGDAVEVGELLDVEGAGLDGFSRHISGVCRRGEQKNFSKNCSGKAFL